MIDDPTVYFLRNAIVVTSIACFQMENRNAFSCSHNGRKRTVCIAQDKNLVWLLFSNYAVDGGQYLADLVTKTR